MSRKAKKKKHLDENGEEPEEDLLLWAEGLTTVVIYGRVMQRLKYDGVSDCSQCHAKPGRNHALCCPAEICVHCRGQALFCKCDPDILNAERDNFVECIERG